MHRTENFEPIDVQTDILRRDINKRRRLIIHKLLWRHLKLAGSIWIATSRTALFIDGFIHKIIECHGFAIANSESKKLDECVTYFREEQSFNNQFICRLDELLTHPCMQRKKLNKSELRRKDAVSSHIAEVTSWPLILRRIYFAFYSCEINSLVDFYFSLLLLTKTDVNRNDLSRGWLQIVSH